MNKFLIRLLNASTLDARPLPGAMYIPPSKPEEQRVRQALGLDNPSLINALILARLVDAFPSFKGLVEERSRSYDYWLEDLPMWESEALVGRLLGTHRGPSHPNELHFEVLADNKVRVKSGKFVAELDYTHDGTYLEALWPDWSGLAGVAELADVDGSELLIPYNPVRVNWVDFITPLQKESGLSEVLNKTGMYRSFHQGHSDAERVAAAVTALALYNNDVAWVD